MNPQKVYLFIHAVNYFINIANWSWAREEPADLACDRLLRKSKSHDTAVSENHQGKESRQDSSFSTTVFTFIDAVCSRENYSRHIPSRTCGRCGLTHNSSSHCLASSAQCDKCGLPNHWQHVCHICSPSIKITIQKRRQLNKGNAIPGLIV